MFQQKVHRPSNRKTLLSLAVTATFSIPALHSASSHAGGTTHPFSYEANGSCYCTEFVAISDIATTMLPTPVGGQSVSQICERLGDGPGLILDNDEYNYPAYADAQCGNGLKTDNGGKSCTLLDGQGEISCGPSGATWDLKTAYATPAELTDPEKPLTSPRITTADSKPALSNAIDATTLPELAAARTSAPAAAKNNSVTAIADQLRAFNNAITSNTVAGQTVADADSTTQEKITIVESSFKAAPPVTQPADKLADKPDATTYAIRDADAGVINESGIRLGIGQASASQNEGAIIGPDTSDLTLSQEDILQFPELKSIPISDPITMQSGDISVISDKDVLEHRQIIIVEQDGSARRMTQEEIARLPLATGVDLNETDSIQTAETATITEEIAEPASAAAISNPDASARPTINSDTPVETWRSSLDYQYIALAPTGYDFGGSGVEVEASASNQKGVSFIGSAGVANEYSEASIGIGFNFAPFKHRTTDVVLNAGVEAGQFDLGITELEDTGGFVGGYIRTRPFGRLELTGGGRYSSYFEGDAVFIASGALRITRQLNAFSKVEVGDNDQFSLGLRYFY